MLDARLDAVLGYVNGEVLLDVGSDHAYLPIEAVRQGKVSSAICGEVVEGPFKSTLRNIAAEGMTGQIEARFGSGLQVVAEGEKVDTVSICGMGGPLIAEILKEGLHRLPNKPRLVLQANIHTYPVRKVLAESGYRVIDETVVQDGHHFYEIIVAEAGEVEYDEQSLTFGPFLLEKREAAFIEKLQRELNHQEKILRNLVENSNDTAKIKEVSLKVEQLKEVLIT